MKKVAPRLILMTLISFLIPIDALLAQGSIGFELVKSVSSWNGQFETLFGTGDPNNGIAFGVRAESYDVYDLSHIYPHQIGGRSFPYLGSPFEIHGISFFNNRIDPINSFFASGEVSVYPGTAQEELRFPIVHFGVNGDSIYQIASFEKYTNLDGLERNFLDKSILAYFTDFDQSYMLTSDLELIALSGPTESYLVTYLTTQPGFTFPRYGAFHQFRPDDMKYIGESYYAIKEADYIHIFDFEDPEAPELVYQIDVIEGSTSQIVDFDVFVEGHYDEVNNFLGDAVLTLLTTGTENSVKKVHIKMKTLVQDMEAAIVQSIPLDGPSIQLFRRKSTNYDGYLIAPDMGGETFTLIKAIYAGVNNPETFEIEAQGRFFRSSCGGYIDFFDGVNTIYESACAEEIEDAPVFYIYNITVNNNEHIETEYTNENLELYSDSDFSSEEYVTLTLPDLVSQHLFDDENTDFEVTFKDGFVMGNDSWDLWFSGGWKMDMSLSEIGSQDIRMDLEMVDGSRSALIDFNISNSALLSSIANINQAPVFSDQSFSVSEFPLNGSKIGTVQAFDPNGDVLEFSIISGNGTGTFSLDSDSGDLLVRDSTRLNLQVQSGFYLTIRASDGDFFTEANVEVNVTEFSEVQNSSPEILDQEFFVDENSPSGAFVGQIVASDPDGDTLVYSILPGPQVGAIDLDSSNGKLWVGDSSLLDFEVIPNLTFEVAVSDGRGGTSRANVTITLNDVFEKTTGIGRFSKAVKVFPNPTTDATRVEVTTEFLGKSSWQIVDIAGRLLMEGQIEKTTFDVSLPKPGVWFLQIAMGNVAETYRLIRM